jgi:hypothetical protein
MEPAFIGHYLNRYFIAQFGEAWRAGRSHSGDAINCVLADRMRRRAAAFSSD